MPIVGYVIAIRSERRLCARAGVENLDLQPEGARGFPHVPQCGLGDRTIGRVDEHRNSNGLGHQLPGMAFLSNDSANALFSVPGAQLVALGGP